VRNKKLNMSEVGEESIKERSQPAAENGGR